MKIGLDAKWFFNGPVSGITVLQNLIPELIKNYPEHQWVIFLDKKDKHLNFPFLNSNVEVYYVWANLNLLSNVFILPVLSKKLNLDVIVYQTFPSFIKSSGASIAFIHDILFEDYPQFFTWKERIYFKPLKFLFKKADRIMVTTEYVKQMLIKHYNADSSTIDIVPLGIQHSFQPLEKINKTLVAEVSNQLKLPKEYILYVGRLNERKNIESLILAFSKLKNESISLVIVGEEDWKTTDLYRVIHEHVRKRIFFVGRISDEFLKVVYASATIFCYPSFAEGFGLPPLEAMASGVPVVVSNTTSMPEVCKDAAVFIDPYKPESITTAIDELLNDNNKIEKLINAGFQHIKFYTWQKTAIAFMDSLNKTY